MSIDWSALTERVPQSQRPMLIAFKAKSDGYLRRMMANPEAPPKLNWSYYASRIPNQSMVSEFQKQYDALAIPYPKDNYTTLVDAQEKSVMAEIENFVKESKGRIADHEDEIKRIGSLIPYELMTFQEYYEAHPEEAIDPDNPTFWPHSEEERLNPVKS